MMSTLRIAWRNLGRNKRRTALMLLAISVAQISVLLMDGLMNGAADMMVDALTGPVFGHAQIHDPRWREEQAPDLVIDRLNERLDRLRATAGVEAAYARIYSPALVAREVDGHAVMIVGLDVEREANRGGMLQGLPASMQPSGRNVLVGAGLAREMNIAVGDELAIIGQAADGSMANDLLEVAGILRTPMDLVNSKGIVMPLAAAQDTFAMPDRAHEIAIRGVESPEQAGVLAERVAGLPDFEGLEVLPWRELAPVVAQSLDLIGVYGYITLLIVFLAAAAGIMNTMLMATFERRRELGMLLSLGTTPGRLVRIILIEAILLGVAGVAIGTLIGVAIVAWQSKVGISLLLGSSDEAAEMAAFGLNFADKLFPYLEWGNVLPGFLGVIVVSVLAALWPAIHMARLEPMEALRG